VNREVDPTHQRVLEIELIGQAGAKQVVGIIGFRLLWTHRESPEKPYAESDYRQFAIPLPVSESPISQALPDFSGATILASIATSI
jgi:hypothetical protein